MFDLQEMHQNHQATKEMLIREEGDEQVLATGEEVDGNRLAEADGFDEDNEEDKVFQNLKQVEF